MPKRIIHRLQEQESFDFGLIGISSAENDYRISWILNNAMGYRLTRQENLQVYHKRLDDPQEFSQYQYNDEETLLGYRLLSNKSENGYLLEEMPNIDFLLQVSGDLNEGFIDELVSRLNALDPIRLAFRLDPSRLKSRKKLLV